MTTIAPSRRNTFQTVQRVLLACVLLVLGVFAVMYASSNLLGASTAQQPSHTLECRRIQMRYDESLHFVAAIGIDVAIDQLGIWNNMSTTQREAALQWCRNNNQPTFNDLYR